MMKLRTEHFYGKTLQEAGAPKYIELLPFRVRKVGEQWRLRCYSKKKKKYIEVQTKFWADGLYTMGVGMGWWEHDRT